VVAVVVARDGVRLDADEIQQALKATIAGFKVPKHVRLAESLPRNAMGKVEKKKLREELANLFRDDPHAPAARPGRQES
jgi:malonyl-CoA/methylmalonyl-CoA synthetase